MRAFGACVSCKFKAAASVISEFIIQVEFFSTITGWVNCNSIPNCISIVKKETLNQAQLRVWHNSEDFSIQRSSKRLSRTHNLYTSRSRVNKSELFNWAITQTLLLRRNNISAPGSCARLTAVDRSSELTNLSWRSSRSRSGW